MREREEMLPTKPTLGVFFDIDKLCQEYDTGSYGFAGWKVIWTAIDVKNLKDVTYLFDGDTRTTLYGHDRVWCAAFQSDSRDNLAYIRSCLDDSSEFKHLAAPMRFAEDNSVAAEPLPGSGCITAKGRWQGRTEYDSYRALDSSGRVSSKRWRRFGNSHSVAVRSVVGFMNFWKRLLMKKPSATPPLTADTKQYRRDVNPTIGSIWQIRSGPEATRALQQAINRGWVEQANSDALLLIPSEKPTSENSLVTLKGTIQCHGCGTSFPFEQLVGLGGYGGRSISCPSCHCQVQVLHCGTDADGALMVVSPSTSFRDRPERRIRLSLEHVEIFREAV
jgi:hypothetical protein